MVYFHTILRVLSPLLLIFALSGCDLASFFAPETPQQPPSMPKTPSQILNLVIVPAELQAGESTEVNFAFNYEDLNADVGPDNASVEVQARVLSGNLSIDNNSTLLEGKVYPDEGAMGQRGSITVSRTFHVPAFAIGTFEVSFALIDTAGQRSNVLTEVLEIKSLTDGGSGIGNGQCAILDGSKTPTTSIRVGRQAFFRVIDPDNNISIQNQDAIYLSAAFESAATGDRENILWLLETGPNTGVFEGPPEGMTLVSAAPVRNNGVLSVADQSTLTVFYKDPNSLSDICIAQARVQ